MRMTSVMAALRITALLCAVLVSPGWGDARRSELSNRVIPGVKLAAPPVIDGDLSDSAWSEAATASDLTDPVDGAPEQAPTVIRIGYDSRAIYVAFHCKSEQPDSIVARQTRKEGSLDSDDFVQFRINPFGTRRGDDESDFSVNPLGTQETDIAGGRAGKQEWQGVWRAAARRTEDGWTAEMAIPWDILTLPGGGKRVDLDVNFHRHVARAARMYEWSNMGAARRRELTGRWTGVELPRQSGLNRLSILGYNYSGRTEGGERSRSGLDSRYSLTPLLTLVGSVNPDFENIEASVEELDFSYAEKLTPERRPFFLEGGDYFQGVAGGDGARIFAPQRIPQFDTGIKLFGKAGPSTSMGILGAFSAHRRDAVVRIREAPTPFTSLSFGWVGRSDSEFRNDVWLLEGRSRSGDWNGSWLYSRSGDLETDGERWALTGGYSTGTVGGGVSISQASPGYRARNGYVPFTDVRSLGGQLWYEGRSRGGPFREYDVWSGVWESRRYDGAFYQRGRTLGISGRTAGDLRVRLSLRQEGFEQFRDRVTTVGFRYPASNPFSSFGISYSIGTRQGSAYRFLAPSFTHRLWNRLTLGLSMESLRHVEDQDLDVFTVNYDLSRQQSLGGRLVRRNHGTNAYLSFRQGGYGGVEYFFILGDPNAERFTSRFVFKVISPLGI